jgi:hypothetical protein
MSHIVVGASGPMTNHLVGYPAIIIQQHQYADIVILGYLNALSDKPLRRYPLKQVYRKLTCGKAIIEKIYTATAEC